MSEIFCSSLFFGWMYAMAMSHSCHTDICSTVRRFSRLLLHSSVISDKNSFFTSSNCSVCFDCRINVATTFRITVDQPKSNQLIFLKRRCAQLKLTWIFQTEMTLRLRMPSVQHLLRYMLRHDFINDIVCGQRQRLLVHQQSLRQKCVQIMR